MGKIVIHKKDGHIVRPNSKPKPDKHRLTRHQSKPWENQKPETGDGAVKAGWICLWLGCIIGIVPFLWMFAAPLILAAFILGIVNLSKEGAHGGLALLLCSIFLPLVVVGVAWVMIGVGGIIAAQSL